MKVGDLIRIKNSEFLYGNAEFIGKIGIIVVCGTWSVDVRIFENGLCPRIAKEDCEVISASR